MLPISNSLGEIHLFEALFYSYNNFFFKKINREGVLSYCRKIVSMTFSIEICARIFPLYLKVSVYPVHGLSFSTHTPRDKSILYLICQYFERVLRRLVKFWNATWKKSAFKTPVEHMGCPRGVMVKAMD